MIKWMDTKKGMWNKVSPTTFPDNTNQIWKLKGLDPYGIFEVEWQYENDGELLQVAQLCHLLSEVGSVSNLCIPFMPYARQDKKISNEETFGLRTFITLLNTIETRKITTFDVHNTDPFSELQTNFVNKAPWQMVQIAEELKPGAIFFPDEGAAKRYGSMFKSLDMFQFNKVPHMFGVKLRDQSTGVITGYGILTAVVPMPKSVLMCDDLCDGGATFITATKKLQECGISDISLYVSHGLFTKGTKILFDSGIKRIYTKDGEVKEIT